MKITLKEIEGESYQPVRESTMDMEFPQVPAKGDEIKLFLENQDIVFEVKEVVYQPKQGDLPEEVALLLTRRDTYGDFLAGLMAGGKSIEKHVGG